MESKLRRRSRSGVESLNWLSQGISPLNGTEWNFLRAHYAVLDTRKIEEIEPSRLYFNPRSIGAKKFVMGSLNAMTQCLFYLLEFLLSSCSKKPNSNNQLQTESRYTVTFHCI